MENDKLVQMKEKFTKEFLVDEYVVKGVKLKRIAEQYDVDPNDLQELRWHYGISSSPEARKQARIDKCNQLGLTKESLESSYETRSIKNLAKLYGYNPSGMMQVMDYLGVHKRTAEESKDMRVEKAKRTINTKEYRNGKMKERMDKLAKTNLEKFGSISPFGNSEVREKSKQTLMKHYGVDHNHKVPSVVEATVETNRRKYGRTIPTRNNEYSINGVFTSSNSEYQFLKDLSSVLEVSTNTVELHNRKLIHPYELDLLLNDRLLAIEVNDTGTHNSSMTSSSYIGHRATDYHFKKSKRCQDINQLLVHYYDDYDFPYLNYIADLISHNYTSIDELLIKYDVMRSINVTDTSKLYYVDYGMYNLPLPGYHFIGYDNPKCIIEGVNLEVYNAGYSVYSKN